MTTCHPERKHYAKGLCKGCYHERYRAATVEQRKAVDRQYQLKKRYDVTPEDYDRMLKAQKGLCAICGRPPKNKALVVDHNHETSQVRGLLCPTCNRTLGFIENKSWITPAMKYLETYGTADACNS